MSLEELRDIVIIVYGVMGILLFLVLLIVAVGIWFAVRGLTRAIHEKVIDPARPTLDEVHQTVQNLRGTTEFLADQAVHPVIRVISLGRGVKRGVRVASALARRRK